ncbi:MAG: hypothetical protein JWQ23_189 [Herminiimonas sp.]|nr:hypothetical protein [Herminiimonas sp.]
MVRALLNGTKSQTRRKIKSAVDELGERAPACPYGGPGDRLWVKETWRRDPVNGAERVIYRATPEHESLGPWKSALFMPRAASRILLEIEATRIERLQDISNEDALAEGIPRVASGESPQYLYRKIWEAINGTGSWESNPLVWVLEFRSV